MTKNTIEPPGLVDQIKPSNATFVAANGEKVMVTRVLPQLPIRVGKQMFPIDFQVTGATTFDLLLGTDFHLMAKPTIS